MSDLWSAFYERLTLTQQQLRAWYARVLGASRIEGLYPDSFWSEAPVKAKGKSSAGNRPIKRRFRLDGQGQNCVLKVKHSAPAGIDLYIDHVTPRQLEWMGRGRRDVTGKRVPIYGNMVLRTNPESLIDLILGDEQLWDELRRVVMPHVAEASPRALIWRRYWIDAHLANPFSYWQTNPVELQELIRVLGALAERIEGVEKPVAPEKEKEA